MPSSTFKVRSSEGGEFDCYLALPDVHEPVPAMVLACAIHGVDADLPQIADEISSHGYIVAAPDLFWRSIPGPLPHDDPRAAERSQPRPEKIKAGEADMADTLAYLRTLKRFNGRAGAMGFCYGGPYAILGPKRLGFEAGMACHGTRVQDYLSELDGVTAPICLHWGDQDHVAPPEVLDAFRPIPGRMKNVEVQIFPGIIHSYMTPSNTKAFDAKTRAVSMARALALLDGLRKPPLRRAS